MILHILRGGAWDDSDPKYCSTKYRFNYYSSGGDCYQSGIGNNSNYDIGFRITIKHTL